MTNHVDIIVTRHEKKDKQPKPKNPGDEIDREQVGLSADGIKDAQAMGQRELRGPYSRVYAVTSNFLRTRQTAKAILEGAGFNVEKEIFGNSRIATVKNLDKLGLGGTVWEGTPGVTEFSYEQKPLDLCVNSLMQHYFLERANEPLDNPNRWPVMARRGAELFNAVADGLDDLAVTLKHGERGLCLVVTHAPTIDSLATVYAKKLEFFDTQRRDSTDKEMYEVNLTSPFEAHNQGAYMRGDTRLDGLNDSHLTLKIKGEEHTMSVSAMRQMAALMKHASYHGVQGEPLPRL